MMKSKTSTPTPSKRVLGIDPGFDRIGVAIMEENKVIFSHCIETDRKSSHQERLQHIGSEIKRFIKDWEPDTLAIESLFFNQNATNALKVSEARGVILYEGVCGGLQIFEYSPQAIKIAVTGYGKADKKQVESMISRLVKLPEKVKRLDDELDAVALCITHLASVKAI
jgi:crossover junction endodeoxyribonuclease RuvC